jgi:hypothetical protein
LREVVNNQRHDAASGHKVVGSRHPVEDETPKEHADVKAETVNFEDSESLVSDVVVDLSLEVVFVSVENTSEV